MSSSDRFRRGLNMAKYRQPDPEEGSLVWKVAQTILFIVMMGSLLGFFLHKISTEGPWNALPF